MKSPIVLLLSLLDDVRRLIPDVEGLDRDIITIKQRVEHEGIGFLTNALPALNRSLDRGLADGWFTCPTGFRKVRGGAIPRLFSGMLCKVFDSITGELALDIDLDIVKCLRGLLLMHKKLALPSSRESELDLKARAKFEECDDACLSEFPLTQEESYTLDRVCRYILPNIEGFDERELFLKHGPGAVEEGVSANQKWEALLGCETLLEYHGVDNILRDAALSGAHVSSFGGTSSDTARLVTVLKDSTSRRTITIEPLERMFIQQGYNALLRDNIKKCDIMRRSMQLTDQSLNQKLALEGSRTGKWSTLDLSSASDLLALPLVELVFKHRPLFLKGLLACRSPKVNTGKKVLILRKYAGMGNATTFPVQSVVFAVIAITALLEGRVPSYRNVERVARLVQVYGDDIIVPTEHYVKVVSLIEKVGLKVNLHKSFATGNFRESCGVDAFRGVDVTPIYVRHHIGEDIRSDANIYAHFVAICNHSWMQCLYSFSEAIKSRVEEGRKLPLVDNKSPLLGWHTRVNARSANKWNPELHRFEIFGSVLLPTSRKDAITGYAALLKFFVTAQLQQGPQWLRVFDPLPPASFEESPVRFKVRTVRKWVPA